MPKKIIPKPLTKAKLNKIMNAEIKKELTKKNPDMKKIKAIRRLKF